MKRQRLIEYAAVIIGAVVLAFAVQAYVVKPYRIPSLSMAATLRPADRVLVNRVVYHLRAPHRGDVVVIDSQAVGRVLIKRIIGLPGETISLSGGHVFIDGRRLYEPYVRRVDGRPEPTTPFEDVEAGWSLQRPYVVPQGHYFLMGDNRSISDDSRDWGPAASSEIIGEAFCTYWPLNRARRL